MIARGKNQNAGKPQRRYLIALKNLKEQNQQFRARFGLKIYWQMSEKHVTRSLSIETIAENKNTAFDNVSRQTNSLPGKTGESGRYRFF